MRSTTVEKQAIRSNTYPLMTGAERLAAVRKIKGIWKNRTPKMITEYKKIRRELNRKSSHSR